MNKNPFEAAVALHDEDDAIRHISQVKHCSEFELLIASFLVSHIDLVSIVEHDKKLDDDANHSDPITKHGNYHGGWAAPFFARAHSTADSLIFFLDFAKPYYSLIRL